MDFSFPPGAHGTGTYNTIGTGTGWSAMARIVREIDEQKIQNYKDDIDTILVFAGLFSAVMTAFLVESYHNLSQDPTQVMVLLMRQLTMQTHSYTMNGGFLNSTAPPLPAIPEFTPTTNAIRVNVLWFASLTLSLVSASFSILVKQWLQEYLSGEFTSPQARIRIRHFRYPGLDHWKVFEIAAALPLLLQLSLALFFVGLCFFTADVHNTVGHTTLPLVAAWAFLFLIVSLAPALSPRCPYKTRLLKSTMQALRKDILRIILWMKNMHAKDIRPLAKVSGSWSYQLLAYNEADVAGTEENDVEIFISVDSIQTDEQLLRAMWDAFQQTTPQFPEAYAFITKVIENRSSISRVIDTGHVADVDQNLDLKRIPKRTVPFILKITSETLRKELDRRSSSAALEPHTEWSPEMKGCLYLLLSETDADIPEAVHQLFLFILDDQVRRRALFQAFTYLAPPPDSFSRVLARLQPAITRANGDNLLDILASLMRSIFCSSPEHSHAALIDVVKDHLDSNSSQHVSAMVKLLMSLTKNALVSMKRGIPSWTTDSRTFLFQLYALDAAASDQCRADSIVEFVRFFRLDWTNLPLIFKPMFSMYDTRCKLIQESAREASIQAAVTASPSGEDASFWTIVIHPYVIL
ncbi:hypothetical protein BC629DRAFT_243365 [Irpex lacteus]|nr:hypothetical protein BC629DRAFT_243365 [Irpex lacteus]